MSNTITNSKLKTLIANAKTIKDLQRALQGTHLNFIIGESNFNFDKCMIDLKSCVK